jgi:hypothetical protein
MKGTFSQKGLEIIPLNHRYGPRQQSLIFKIACRIATVPYEFLEEGSHNVKCDQLICLIPQLLARKIFMHFAAVRRICRPSCYATLTMYSICEAAHGVDIS